MTEPAAQALVVGISRYLHVGTLANSGDARAVYDVLVDPAVCGYPKDRVRWLAPDQATRAAVLAALDAVCAEAATDDARTFVYLTGHGGQDGPGGAAYFLPVDADPGALATTAISAAELQARLARCRGELTVVLDCCRAARVGGGDLLGSFGDGLAAALPPVAAAGPPVQRAIVAASIGDGISYTAPGGASSFLTGHLVACLRGAGQAIGQPVDVTIDRLYAYVEAQVRAGAGGAQIPLLLAQYTTPYRVTRRAKPPPLAGFTYDALFSYDRDDDAVASWVRDLIAPALAAAGLRVLDPDPLGGSGLGGDLLARCAYVIAVFTQGYVAGAREAFTATMAMVDAVESGRRRFVPILRERITLPPDVATFVALDMSPAADMKYAGNLERLVGRLRKAPDEIG